MSWLFHSDALTFPLTIVLRLTELESPERKLPQAVEEYRKWFLARLRLLDKHLKTREYLYDHRFTIADITVAYALNFGEMLDISLQYKPQVKDYLGRLKSRDAFQRTKARGRIAKGFGTCALRPGKPFLRWSHY